MKKQINSQLENGKPESRQRENRHTENRQAEGRQRESRRGENRQVENRQRKNRQPVTKGCAKVPIVMQMEALECGAAALAMILAYYNKWIPLEQVRRDCGVSRDGSSAGNVLKAARNYGLDAKGFRYDVEDLQEHGAFPCIIHWNMNHFVVLNGFKGGRASINDPARGSCFVSMEDFEQAFTGICMMFEPGALFEPGGSPKSVISFAKKRLSGAGSALVFAALTTLIGAMFGIIMPAFSRIFMDRLLTDRNPEWFVPFLLALGGMSAIQIAVAFIQAVYSLRINGKLAVVGNASYMWKILRMPMEFFSQRMAGDIQQRQSTNASIANSLVNTLAPLALHMIMMIFYLCVMVRYSPMLTLIGLFSIAANFALSNIISKKRVNLTRVQMRDAGKLSGAAVAGIEMIETIKASGAENGYFEKWAGYQASVNTQEIRFLKLNQYLGMLPQLVSSLTNSIILVLGVWLTIKGQFTAGMVMAFQGFLNSFSAPALTLIRAGQVLQEMRTQMERVEDIMEYPLDDPFDDGRDRKETRQETPHQRQTDQDKSEQETAGQDKPEQEISYDKLSGQLEMRDVTFGYARLGDPLIEKFNLSLKPGSRVAFCGASGCGKSTLSKLISGLYKPWSGEILFDGRLIAEIDRSVFTGSLAVVDQDIILFEDTIANNIKMWDSTIEDFEMIMAARDARLHEDIMQRDGGYQYKIAEGGKDFSGGQRQRMEIARVLAQDPTIIILDEATSALDAKTEYEVVQSIKDRGITCLIVAHRLSTIRDCDEIIVLDHGRVVERGTHEQLYALGGKYTQLVSNE